MHPLLGEFHATQSPHSSELHIGMPPTWRAPDQEPHHFECELHANTPR